MFDVVCQMSVVVYQTFDVRMADVCCQTFNVVWPMSHLVCQTSDVRLLMSDV